MLTVSVNKSFLLTLSSMRVLWLWRQRIALMKESLSGFSFEFDSRPSGERSWTLVEEGKEFAGHSIGYCFAGLVACLRLCISLCFGLCVWLPNSVLFIYIYIYIYLYTLGNLCYWSSSLLFVLFFLLFGLWFLFPQFFSMRVVVGFGCRFFCLFIGLVFELGLFLFILLDVCLWMLMAFDLVWWMKDSGYWSLEEKFFVCSNSLFSNTKRILKKYFCIQEKYWSWNALENKQNIEHISFFRFRFSTYIQSDLSYSFSHNRHHYFFEYIIIGIITFRNI